MFGFSLASFSITFMLIAVVGFIVVRVRRVRATSDARARVLDGSWIDARSMAAGWNEWVGKYQDDDGPGCYIIAAFDHEVEDGNYTCYKDIYVGKADKAYEAAHSQIAGQGIDEIARDIEDENRFVYVQIRFYEKKALETREKDLIKILGAQESYNRPQGE